MAQESCGISDREICTKFESYQINLIKNLNAALLIALSDVFTFLSCSHLWKKTENSTHPRDGEKDLPCGRKIPNGTKPIAFPLKQHRLKHFQKLFFLERQKETQGRKHFSFLLGDLREVKQGKNF